MKVFLAQAVNVPVGQRLGGRLAMMLVATTHNIIFQCFFSCRFSLFPPLSTFLIEGVPGSEIFFSESWREHPETLGKPPFQTPSAIFGPPSSHFGFWRRCGIAGGGRVPPEPLGCFFWGGRLMATKSLIYFPDFIFIQTGLISFYSVESCVCVLGG